MTMSFSDVAFLIAACVGAVLFACFLGGGFCCGFVMLGRLLGTLFRRQPWPPSLWVYSLGILACIPAYAANYAGANSAILLQRSAQHLHPAPAASASSWLGFAFFVLPLVCNWAAWALYRLESPVPAKDLRTAPRHPPSETSWPPPPTEPVAPPSPLGSRKTRGWR